MVGGTEDDDEADKALAERDENDDVVEVVGETSVGDDKEEGKGCVNGEEGNSDVDAAERVAVVSEEGVEVAADAADEATTEEVGVGGSGAREGEEEEARETRNSLMLEVREGMP